MSSTAALARKELLQLVPLAATLVVTVLTLGFLHYQFSPRYFEERFLNRLEHIVLLLPLLFATGAGAILVGMEREQRTFRWLLMLPVSPRRLILVKGLVGVSVLVLLWGITMILISWLGAERPAGTRISLRDSSVISGGVHWGIWWLRTLFVLSVSFYTAWKIRNPLLSLVALLFLLCLPSLFVWVISLLPLNADFGPKTEFTRTAVMLVLMTLFFAIGGYWAALKDLSPSRGQPLDAKQVARLRSGNKLHDGSLQFHSPTAALLWQSLRSMWAVWLVLSLMLGLSLLLRTPMFWDDRTGTPLFPSVVLGILAVCWLGVSVFQFAGSPRSLRWLAQIGHSPLRLFCARHAVPLAILSIVLVLYTALASVGGIESSERPTSLSGRGEAFSSPLQILLISAWLYSVSQWVSQRIRNVAIAYLVAPLVAWPVVHHFITDSFSPPMATWGVIVCIILFTLLSLLMMRRYLLGQASLPYEIFSVGAAILALVVANYFTRDYRHLRPVVVSGLETNPVARRSPVLLISRLVPWYEAENRDPEQLALDRRLSAAWATDLGFPLANFFENGEQVLQGKPAAISLDYSAMNVLVSAIAFQRLEFQSSPSEVFPDSLRFLGRLIAGLRRSDRWLDQEFADRLEIYLLDLIRDPKLDLGRDPDLITDLVSDLPTKQQRNEARRRAILQSHARWWELKGQPGYLLGGMMLDQSQRSSAARRRWDEKFERIDRVVAAGMTAIDSSAESQQWRHVLHDQLVSALVPMEIGPYSQWSRRQTHLAYAPAFGSYGSTWIYPSRWVGLPWENAIEKLKDQP